MFLKIVFFRVRRPVYGYPKMITKYWRDLLPSPGNYHKGIDAVVQTRENNIFRTLFFFGYCKYTKFNLKNLFSNSCKSLLVFYKFLEFYLKNLYTYIYRFS